MNMLIATALACCFAMGGWFQPASHEQVSQEPAPGTFVPYRAKLDLNFSVNAQRAKTGEKSLDVDLLTPCHHMGARPYVDFTVTPRFNPGNREPWSVVFSTTNAACGLLASTDLLPLAPESGYEPRIEVPLSVYTNKMFSLYLKTRTPTFYVRLASPACRGELWGFGESSSLRFRLGTVDLDLKGSRLVNPDRELGDLGVLCDNDLYWIAYKKAYAQWPYDLPARIANRRKRMALDEQIDGLRVERRNLNEKLFNMKNEMQRSGTNYPEIPKLTKKVQEVTKKIQVLADECRQLDFVLPRMYVWPKR